MASDYYEILNKPMGQPLHTLDGSTLLCICITEYWH